MSLKSFIVFVALAFVLVAAGIPRVAAQTSLGSMGEYRLSPDDRVKVSVFGQPDLSGELTVDSTGNVQVPLLGPVKAVGLTAHELEGAIAAALRTGEYLKDPHVNLQVTNYRPFSIIGEVNKPGQYPYANGMNVLNAVALAGGFTFRADEHVIYLRRQGQSTEHQLPADQSTQVLPGDVVRIGERFF